MNEPNFIQRFATGKTTLVENDFPRSARVALIYILQDLIEKEYIETERSRPWDTINRELLRIARSEIYDSQWNEGSQCEDEILYKLEWPSVYVFCERIYQKLLSEKSYYDSNDGDLILEVSLDTVRQYYTNEINNMLAEENIGYQMQNGVFYKPGHVQTQKNLNRSAAVLSDDRYEKSRKHFVKAARFFSQVQNPDFENAVKEAVCSLEAAAEIASDQPVSKDFVREMRRLSGNSADQIPPPLVESMIKLFSYRGQAEGVSHGNTKGAKITKIEAEAVLSVCAAFITYLSDFQKEIDDDIPF